ncbi:hypothetical protein BN2156_01222 [Mycolicibacterium neworleansense]|uniref:Uncharacterized protein n=1 Tax=Mycolicibacterium neworleansense TaxID=146018 RepID=A0A0H5RK43_9MYCO|nr:hypothetical protein BN2156_01222 [Mycolicibacterium neworleansense]
MMNEGVAGRSQDGTHKFTSAATANDDQFRIVRPTHQRPRRPASCYFAIGDNLGIPFGPLPDALNQRLFLTGLIFQPPLVIGCPIREATGQFTTAEDGREISAAQSRFLESPLGCVLGGVGTVDTDYDRLPLLLSGIVLCAAHNDHWTVPVSAHGYRYRPGMDDAPGIGAARSHNRQQRLSRQRNQRRQRSACDACGLNCCLRTCHTYLLPSLGQKVNGPGFQVLQYPVLRPRT